MFKESAQNCNDIDSKKLYVCKKEIGNRIQKCILVFWGYNQTIKNFFFNNFF
jgi:hypothetical protein